MQIVPASPIAPESTSSEDVSVTTCAVAADIAAICVCTFAFFVSIVVSFHFLVCYTI